MRDFLINIKSENRIDKIRLIMTDDDVIGGQPNNNDNEFTSNTPLLDLACTMKFTIDAVKTAQETAENAGNAASTADQNAGKAQESADAANEAAGTAQKRADDAFNRVKPIEEGGTGAKNVASARTNLGLKSAATLDKTDDFGTSTSLVATQALVDKLQKEMLKATEVPVDKIFVFDGAIPPAGYIERKGVAINKETMPKLFARYGTHMPDDRDRVHRMAGSLAGIAGTTQEDAMQKITGSFGNNVERIIVSADGVFKGVETGDRESDVSLTGKSKSFARVLFDNSLIARTSEETRVKARIIIACNKIQ